MIIGVIGLGSIGMRHAKNLLAMGHEVYGYDPKGAGEIKPMSDNCGDYDAVIIASPTNDHADAFDHWGGTPVFMEKPLSDKPWKNKVIPLMMGNNMRYHQVVKVVRERMAELGEWESAWFHLAQRNTKYTDPVILNWGAHEVDLALYLLDRNLTVDKEITEVQHDDACVRLESANGRQVDIHLDYLTEPWERHFTIHCRNGSIHGDLENYTVHIFGPDGREIIAVEGSHDQTYVDEMKEFIRRVEGKPSDGIGATGEEGLVCLKLLLEAQK